ncbi:hypothetical protein D9M68_429840 [compost metagenome]
MSTLASRLNSSPDRCGEPPRLVDAKFSEPGARRACSMSCATEAMPSLGLTSSTLGELATSVTGAKPCAESYGICA